MSCWFNRHNYIEVSRGDFEMIISGLPTGNLVEAIEYHCTKCGDRKVVPL